MVLLIIELIAAAGVLFFDFTPSSFLSILLFIAGTLFNWKIIHREFGGKK
ncbi:hypothetical protein [Streptococcus fryi]